MACSFGRHHHRVYIFHTRDEVKHDLVLHKLWGWPRPPGVSSTAHIIDSDNIHICPGKSKRRVILIPSEDNYSRIPPDWTARAWWCAYVWRELREKKKKKKLLREKWISNPTTLTRIFGFLSGFSTNETAMTTPYTYEFIPTLRPTGQSRLTIYPSHIVPWPNSFPLSYGSYLRCRVELRSISSFRAFEWSLAPSRRAIGSDCLPVDCRRRESSRFP